MDQPGNHVLLRGNQPGAADRMRELLARTVQDHVADQRSNAGTLEDIRQRMEGLEWLVKEVREREIPGMSGRLDGLVQHFDDTASKPPQWAESLAEHIELLRAQVTPVAELHSLWADLGTVSENVEQAMPRLQAMCETIGQAMDVLRAQDERMTKLQQSVGKLQQAMDSAASRFSRLDKSIAELGQRTGQLDKEISAIKGRTEVGFSGLAAKVEQNTQATSGLLKQNLEAVTATVDTRLGAIDNRLGTVDGKVGVLGGRLDGLDGRMEGVGARIEGLGEKFGTFDGRLETANGRFTDVTGRLETLGQQVVAVGGQLSLVDEHLSQTLEPLNDELRSRPGPVEFGDTVAKIVDAAQNDVTAHLGSLEETVLTLAEALLRPRGRPVPAPREGTDA
jgi:chromosome segregation ATPase